MSSSTRRSPSSCKVPIYLHRSNGSLGPVSFVDQDLTSPSLGSISSWSCHLLLVLSASPSRAYLFIKSFSVVVVSRYLPFQSVHGPYEAPMSFVELYNKTIVTANRRIHQGMVTALDQARLELLSPRACCASSFSNWFMAALDQAVGNITATFDETGLYANSLIWFSSDNGGPLPTANNFPLRSVTSSAMRHAFLQPSLTLNRWCTTEVASLRTGRCVVLSQLHPNLTCCLRLTAKAAQD